VEIEDLAFPHYPHRRVLGQSGLVNGLLPNAAIRGCASVTQLLQSSGVDDRSAELVAHAAAWLAHDQCSASGEFFAVKSGSMREIFVSVGRGFPGPASR
jgi:hypothetical protein